MKMKLCGVKFSYLYTGLLVLVTAGLNACAINAINSHFPVADSEFSIKELGEKNQIGLTSLQVGLAKSQVKNIMGFYYAEEYFCNGSLKITNPFKIETFTATKNPVEAYYYLTEIHSIPGTSFIKGAVPPRIKNEIEFL